MECFLDMGIIGKEKEIFVSKRFDLSSFICKLQLTSGVADPEVVITYKI